MIFLLQKTKTTAAFRGKITICILPTLAGFLASVKRFGEAGSRIVEIQQIF